MTGLFISLDEYYTDPIEEELQGLKMREEYIMIPSISNSKEWLRKHNYMKSRHCLRDEHGKFVKKNILR